MAKDNMDEEYEVEEAPEESGEYLVDPEESSRLFFEDDEPNLVEVFVETEEGRRALKDLSEKFCDDYDVSWKNSEEYRQSRADEWKIFSGELKKKDFPFENCANVHIPIAMVTLSRLQSRTMSEIFGDWTNVFGVLPIGPDDKEIAEILSAHGNWQIREQILDFKRQQARGTLLFYLNGDVTCHSYYNFQTKKNRHEMLTTDEFFTPYVYCTTMPDYSDCPFVGRILKYYRHELEAQRGIWWGVDHVLAREPASWMEDPEMPMRDAEADIQGVVIPDSTKSSPYTLIQYEGWVTLPQRTRQRFVKAVVDIDTKNILF